MTLRNTGIENSRFSLKLGTALLIIMSTVTTEASLLGVYYSLKGEIKDVATQQNTQTQINNMRFLQIEDKQREDRETMRLNSARLEALEQQKSASIQIDNQKAQYHK